MSSLILTPPPSQKLGSTCAWFRSSALTPISSCARAPPGAATARAAKTPNEARRVAPPRWSRGFIARLVERARYRWRVDHWELRGRLDRGVVRLLGLLDDDLGRAQEAQVLTDAVLGLGSQDRDLLVGDRDP